MRTEKFFFRVVHLTKIQNGFKRQHLFVEKTKTKIEKKKKGKIFLQKDDRREKRNAHLRIQKKKKK